MSQWRVILVVLIALGSGALWMWHEGSLNVDATPARAEAAVPVEQPPVPESDRTVASDATPADPLSPPAQPAPVPPEDNQSTTSAAVEPPNVDAPEAPERKFARGGRADSDPN